MWFWDLAHAARCTPAIGSLRAPKNPDESPQTQEESNRHTVCIKHIWFSAVSELPHISFGFLSQWDWDSLQPPTTNPGSMTDMIPIELMVKPILTSVAKPFIPSLPTAALASSTLLASSSDTSSSDTPSDSTKTGSMNPRLHSILYMGGAMSLHFGGYEFFRNACLALFTSSDYGFQSPAAFPLANGFVSPFSLILLWYYSQQLHQRGPRVALRSTTLLSIIVVLAAAGSLHLCRLGNLSAYVSQAIIGLTFLFQNSYQYLLYTQQWSFVGSVLTPDEGSRWFPALAGFSSVVCSATSSMVPYILPHSGILGLMALTSVTLSGSYLLGDHAYSMSEKHGFDPAKQLQERQKSKTAKTTDSEGRLGKAIALFRRVPILAILFFEVIMFQSLNTILNVAFVRTLKRQIPQDLARAAYSGRFYGLVNAVSAALQFLVLPLCMRYAEPAWIWRIMPVVPLLFCVMQVTKAESSLLLVAGAVFLCKTIDYAIRSVVSPMVYQPLDFESRFVGKEVIGVFGSRFGKSGMSLILSGLTSLGVVNMPRLNIMSLVAAAGWFSATFSLSQIIPRKAHAQAVVEERIQEDKKTK